MLNQFYNYLSDRIIEFYNRDSLNLGEKYYIQLDTEDQVKSLYNSIGESSLCEEFIYKHKTGMPYKTYCINVNGVRIVVAATINVTSGFLVTLRNKVSEQEGQWSNTSLLIISNEELDSITAGCSSLQKEGMPLSIKSISNNLVQLIDKKEFHKRDREVLKFYLKKKLEDDIIYTSIWDYEELLSIINRCFLQRDDYYYIGLFYDEELDRHTSSRIKKRLSKNYELYQRVKHCHEYENPEGQLEKYFDAEGVYLLRKYEWYTLDFEFVKKSNENSGIKDKPLIYEENLEKKSEEFITYWERAAGNSKVAQRKRHIIVFNENSRDEINLTFKFNEILSKNYIGREAKGIATTSGERLMIKLKINNPIFYQRVLYTHKGQSKSKFEFNIVVISCNEDRFKSIKTNYTVNCKQKIINIDSTSELIPEDLRGEWYEEATRFTLSINDALIEFEIDEKITRAIPVQPLRIWKEKREFKADFSIDNNKVIQETREYYINQSFKKYLNYEEEIINKEILYGTLINGHIEKIDIKVNNKLLNAYKNIINYYRENSTIPSLAHLNSNVIGLYKDFLILYNNEIEEMEENSILSDIDKKAELHNIGKIAVENKILISPLSPINMAYQLQIYDKLGSEFVEQEVLESLKPNNLLPYIYGKNDSLLRPIFQKDAIEWMVYDSIDKVSLSGSDKYISNLVKGTMEKFIGHHKFLFLNKSTAPIKINLVNIQNDKEIVSGIFNFIKKQLESKALEAIIPIEINIYNKGLESSFDKFFSCEGVSDVEEKYDISLKSKKYDEIDVLRIIQDNIKYYKFQERDRFEYSHITFYKIAYDNKTAHDNMSEIESGSCLDGLISKVKASNNRSSYRSGFGIRNLENRDNLLIRTAINLNELEANSLNGGDNPYRNDIVIVTKPYGLRDDEGLGLYENSNWVTFIEPNIGQEYFHRSSEEIKLVHYSDKNSITVSNKANRYSEVLRNFLKIGDSAVTSDKVNTGIRIFNSINGEWLLNTISSSINNKAERLSIINGINEVMSLLEEENLLWIPIDMDMNNKKEKGVYSENLLFVGIDIRDEEIIKIRFYPVEIKIGYKFDEKVNMYNNNIDEIYYKLKSELNYESFKSKYYRNILIEKVIDNSEKFILNNLWDKNNFEYINQVKHLLLNDEFELIFDTHRNLGIGSIISFKRGIKESLVEIRDDKLYIELKDTSDKTIF